MENKGVIYILTNPSFPEYVKIGYADDVEKRLKEFNKNSCVPFAFRIYATYSVADRLQDKELHKIIDNLNPSLRAIDNFEGKQRKREFYAMSAEEAYNLLEGIAKINGLTRNLTKYEMSKEDIIAEETAEVVKEESSERLSPFTFAKCDICVGEEIIFCNDENVKCVVVDDKHVSYDGKIFSLSALAKKLVGTSSALAGPKYFKYNGEFLNVIRNKKEGRG